jgi:hypothetical protein
LLLGGGKGDLDRAVLEVYLGILGMGRV